MVAIFSRCTGQNNVATPISVPFGENGIGFLEASSDVLITKAGKIAGCRSGSRLETGSFHSTYPAIGGFYGAKDRTSDTAIYKFVPDATGAVTKTGVISGLFRGSRVDYCLVGKDVYYLNGSECGRLIDEEHAEWPISLWPGPEPSADMIPLPIGTHIDILAGRILTTKNDELFFSEYALPGIMDRTRNNRRFESRLRMVYAVQTGCFVSDERAVYFLLGNDPNAWTIKKALDYPALEWCRYHGLVKPSDYGFDTSELSALFGTPYGPVIGFSDGTCKNLIDNNLKLPGCSTAGAILVVDKTMILQEV